MKTLTHVYETISSRCRYDLAVAAAINNELFTDNLDTGEFLKRNKQIVEASHLGCCLNFSLYLMVKLKEAGIHSMLISTPEEGGLKASVAYEVDGNWYVADIVEDIKCLTNAEKQYAIENGLPITYRKEVRQKFSEYYSRNAVLPLDKFKEQNDSVEMYADIFLYSGKMSAFMKTGHCI